MNCQEMEELLGAYALEALSEEERRAADAHLATCPNCTRTLQQLRAIVDLFPLTVPAIDPPPRVKEHIMARILEEETARQQTMADLASPRLRSRVRQQTQAPRRRWQTALLAAIMAVLLLLVGASLVWNLSLRQQVAQLSSQIAPPIVYTLHGAGSNATASGQVLYYPSQNITVLVIHNLPQLNGTQVYQGWLLQGNRPTSIGLFNVQHDIATLDFQGNVTGYDAAAISLEPGPLASASAPKGPVVALGELKTT